MLEKILDNQIIFFAVGVVCGIGILSKVVSQVTLKRLVKAASNMNKSNHNLMKLIKAKFEHACMVSDKVENVRAFVDKYIYEYRVMGLRLHTWRQLEKKTIWMCGILGAAGAFISYYVDSMNDSVLQYGALGGAGVIMLFIVHMSTDENYRMEATKVYIVDYLENVCAHRYARVYHQSDDKLEEALAIQEEIEQLEAVTKEDENTTTWEVKVQEMRGPEIEQPKVPEVETNIDPVEPPAIDPIPVTEPELPRAPQVEFAEEKEKISREVKIREILEEFLA